MLLKGIFLRNALINPLYIHISRLIAIRKRHIIAILHISKPWIGNKTITFFLKGVGCKKGDAVSCPQAHVGKMMHKDMHKIVFQSN